MAGCRNNTGDVEDAKQFKDRLLGSDQISQASSSIIDDQADYFSIEGNAWLDRDERRRLREEQQAQEAAEEKRRRKIGVSLDLLGRKVEEANPTESIGFVGIHSETNEHAESQQGLEDPSADEVAHKARKAAEATQAVSREGGGGGAAAALQTARQRELSRGLAQPQSFANAGSGRIKDDSAFDELLLALNDDTS